MESVGSFSTAKSGKSYIVYVENLHPFGNYMTFQVDSGASVTFLGLNSFCDEESPEYNILKNVFEKHIAESGIGEEIILGETATKEKVQMYPCKFDGVSISGSRPITLYFYFYIGNVGMPLLGFDYIDDCSYSHSIAGNLVITAVADNVGKRFYPDNVIDFNMVLNEYTVLASSDTNL